MCKAAVDFAGVTARLKPRPFKPKVKTRVFPKRVRQVPGRLRLAKFRRKFFLTFPSGLLYLGVLWT